MTIGYTLTTTRGTYSGYRVAMVYNDGRWRLCGWVTSRSARSCSRTRLAIQIDTPTSLAPRELLRVEAPPGMTSGEDRSAPMSKRLDANLGYQKGWTRTWNEPGFGGVRVSAFQYRSPRQAVAFTNSTLADRCWDTVGVFTDPAAPTAIGTRQRGYGWTGIQPPGLGPYIDNLWLVRGRTVLFVGASPLAEGSDHQQVFSMMHAILNLTNSKGK